MSDLGLVAPFRSAERRFQDYLAVHSVTEGWFRLESAAIWDALLARQKTAGIEGHLLEIGVWHGKSAALLASHLNTAMETCVLVDLHMERERVEETLNRTDADLSAVRLLPTDSRRLPLDPLMVEGFRAFRWIHIDGEHTGDAVTNDMAVANSLLSADGVVVVDDFFSWMYPQITEAVFRYVRANPDHFALFLCGFNKAYLARPHRSHEWLAFCRDGLSVALEARDVETTLSKTTYPGEMNVFGIGPRGHGRAQRGPDWDPDTIRI